MFQPTSFDYTLILSLYHSPGNDDVEVRGVFLDVSKAFNKVMIESLIV